MFNNFIIKLQSELQKPLPGYQAQQKMMPTMRDINFTHDVKPRESAVLILFYENNKQIYIIFIRRKEDKKVHSGQIAFPGGKYEEEDKTLKNTAIRETYEEIGISENDITVIGQLTEIIIPISNYKVTPFVGFLKQKPVYNISLDEVQEVLEVNISQLFAPENRLITELERNGIKIHAPYFKIDNDKIWGATAMITSELNEVISNTLESLTND